jgi:hypothetical protein
LEFEPQSFAYSIMQYPTNWVLNFSLTIFFYYKAMCFHLFTKDSIFYNLILYWDSILVSMRNMLITKF